LSTTAKYWAVLPAAGSGSRFSTHVSKQYLSILGKTVMQHSVDTLCQLELSGCVVAISAQDDRAQQLSFNHQAMIHWVKGGAERMDSVLAALDYLRPLAQDDDWVLVHDVARPCIRREQLNQLLHELNDNPVGGLLAVPVRDTLKQAVIKPNNTQQVVKTVPRDQLWQCQTPQMFRFGILLKALEMAKQQQILVTDEANAIELLNLPITLVHGRADNIKITYPEDLALATAILQSQ
jgi:2-C-methyl-D-erythritol 4-phosphate cytidylyltransferase